MPQEPDRNANCIEVIFRPALPPRQRHRIEDRLERVLERHELGDVDGGGGYLNDEESNIFVFTPEPNQCLPLVRQALRISRAPSSTLLRIGASRELVPLYDNTLHPRPWWKLW